MTDILVVDDQLAMRNMFKAIFKGSKYKVETANDGVEACNLANTQQFSLVLADLIMPNMGGIELIEKLREHKNYREIPIFIVSSLLNDENKKRAKSAGANGSLKKPIDATQVLNLVKQCIG